ISLKDGTKKHTDRETHELQQLLLDPKRHNSEESEITYYFEIPGSSKRPPNPVRRRPYVRPEDDVTYYYEEPPKFLNPIPNRWKSSTQPIKNRIEKPKIINDNALTNYNTPIDRNDVSDDIEYIDHPDYPILPDYALLDDYKQDDYPNNEIVQDFFPTTMDPNRLYKDNTEVDYEDSVDPFDEVNYSFFPFSDEVAINWMPENEQTNKKDKKENEIVNESLKNKEYLS
ncbi:unnamed protein product, partial [Meganyctiphanes norvegica]